jgi:hypothetical protein
VNELKYNTLDMKYEKSHDGTGRNVESLQHYVAFTFPQPSISMSVVISWEQQRKE